MSMFASTNLSLYRAFGLWGTFLPYFASRTGCFAGSLSTFWFLHCSTANRSLNTEYFFLPPCSNKLFWSEIVWNSSKCSRIFYGSLRAWYVKRIEIALWRDFYSQGALKTAITRRWRWNQRKHLFGRESSFSSKVSLSRIRRLLRRHLAPFIASYCVFAQTTKSPTQW